jgi:hypothetical protein
LAFSFFAKRIAAVSPGSKISKSGLPESLKQCVSRNFQGVYVVGNSRLSNVEKTMAFNLDPI